jgi:2,3,4,5-tetrahydropyridine-2-carboxylate N-succinyltransferase
MQAIETLIDDAFERRNTLTQAEVETHLRPAIGQVLDLLESGERRVAEPDGHGGWTVNQWIKKAVLLYFRINDNRVVDGGPAQAFDKVPLRFAHGNDAELQQLGARVVPGALVRRGAHIAKDAVLMPSYVNIGAWVGPGSMVDTWATVGSCAQIHSTAGWLARWRSWHRTTLHSATSRSTICRCTRRISMPPIRPTRRG